MEENSTISEQYSPLNKKRNFWTALILSFFCFGLGHIYCGQLKRGFIIYFIANFFLFFSLIFIILLPFPISIILTASIFTLIYGLVMFDAVRTALKFSKNYILKSFNKWYIYFIIYIFLIFVFSAFIISPIVKTMILEAFRLPTISMENTLLVEDYIVVDKMAYGIHIPFSSSYLNDNENVKRGDIIVYLFPGERDEVNPAENVYYLKRCVGIPGDTILIENKELFINGSKYQEPEGVKYDNVNRPEDFVNPRMFPQGSEFNENWYGPVVVPKKDQVLKIDSSNFKEWEVFIKREGHTVKLRPDNLIILDDEELPGNEYIVEMDYLFLLGDNRNNSLDSRFTGFIAEDNIVGKAYFIYWSENINGGIRWDRIGNTIQ